MLKTYLEISLGMSAVILTLILLTPLLSKRYGALLRYAVWIVCAVMLLVPFKRAPKLKIEIPHAADMQYAAETRTVPASDASEQLVGAETETAHGGAVSAQTARLRETGGEAVNEGTRRPDAETVLTVLWLTGAALFMLYCLISYAVFLHKIRPWCRSAEIRDYRGRPRVVYCKLIKSPMLVGFFRPRILLPRENYTDGELEIILKHELTHYRRGDLWIKLLFALANAVHWFNPAVYAMRKAANRDMEFSCDEIALRGADRQSRREYSMAILRCAAPSAGTELSTYFGGTKKNLKQRFKNILSEKKRRGIAVGITLVLAAVICAGAVAFVSGTDEGENYLLLGEDNGNRIDMLMAGELKDGSLEVTIIPRSSVKNYLPEEITAESIETLRSAVSELIGQPLDKYAVIDTDSAEKLLQNVSGVTFTIPDLYGDGVGMVYDDPYQDLHIALPPGEKTLDASEMMGVIRYRKGNLDENGQYNGYENPDADRAEMTAELLKETVKQKTPFKDADDSLLESAQTACAGNGNVTLDDLRAVYKAVKKRKVEFKVLENAENPDIVYAADTERIGYTADKLVIDGEEIDVKTDGGNAMWLNTRFERFHTCYGVISADGGEYFCIKPNEKIFYGGGDTVSGKFMFIRGTQKALDREQTFKEEFDGTVTGIHTQNPVIRSNDGKYEANLNAADRNLDYAEELRERYTAIYGETENLYAGVGGNFCMPVSDGIKVEEYDLNGDAPNGIEKLWNVSVSEADISIKLIDKVIDIPDSEEVLKQRFYNTPWGEDEESPYATGEYTITDFMKHLFTVDKNSDEGKMGYDYIVNFSEGGSRYVRELPVSDTKTLRISADIRTADEGERKKLIDIAKSVKVVK